MNQRKKQPDHRGRYSPCPAAVAESNEELIEQYLEWKKTHTRRAAKAYAIWIRRFQAFADKPPEEFTIDDWTGFARSLDGRFAPKCVQFALSVVHNYLRFWHEQYRLQRLPLFLARVQAARARSYSAIEEDEYRDMVAYHRKKGETGLRDLAIIMLLHDTGMRVGELVQLEIEHIQQDASAVIDTEKTTGKRRVFWNTDTDEVLQQLIVQRVNSGTDSDWLFVRKNLSDEVHLDRRSVERVVAQTARKVGIDRRVCPHSFRHAFIHRLAKLGVADALIAQLVGHSTPHAIAHYTKLSRPEFEEVARKQFGALPVAA